MVKFPFRGMDYSPWSSKNLIDRNRLKKFMQVEIDVKCMHTDFGGRGLSGFGDKISLWSIKVEKFNRSESAQKIHARRDQCHVHVHQFWWAWSRVGSDYNAMIMIMIMIMPAYCLMITITIIDKN